MEFNENIIHRDASEGEFLKDLYDSMADQYFYKGKAAFDREEFDVAVQEYSMAATLGHVEGAYMAGFCYYRKFPKSRDFVKAFKYFEMASKKGHAQSTYYLAECYRRGRGIRQNAQRAFELYKESADMGYEPAKRLVAFIENELSNPK